MIPFPSIQSVEDIHQTIKKVAEFIFCSGVQGFMEINDCKTGIKIENSYWISTECEEITKAKKMCEQCTKLYRCLKIKKSRMEKRKKMYATIPAPIETSSTTLDGTEIPKSPLSTSITETPAANESSNSPVRTELSKTPGANGILKDPIVETHILS